MLSLKFFVLTCKIVYILAFSKKVKDLCWTQTQAANFDFGNHVVQLDPIFWRLTDGWKFVHRSLNGCSGDFCYVYAHKAIENDQDKKTAQSISNCLIVQTNTRRKLTKTVIEPHKQQQIKKKQDIPEQFYEQLTMLLVFFQIHQMSQKERSFSYKKNDDWKTVYNLIDLVRDLKDDNNFVLDDQFLLFFGSDRFLQYFYKTEYVKFMGDFEIPFTTNKYGSLIKHRDGFQIQDPTLEINYENINVFHCLRHQDWWCTNDLVQHVNNKQLHAFFWYFKAKFSKLSSLQIQQIQAAYSGEKNFLGKIYLNLICNSTNNVIISYDDGACQNLKSLSGWNDLVDPDISLQKLKVQAEKLEDSNAAYQIQDDKMYLDIKQYNQKYDDLKKQVQELESKKKKQREEINQKQDLLVQKQKDLEKLTKNLYEAQMDSENYRNNINAMSAKLKNVQEKFASVKEQLTNFQWRNSFNYFGQRGTQNLDQNQINVKAIVDSQLQGFDDFIQTQKEGCKEKYTDQQCIEQYPCLKLVLGINNNPVDLAKCIRIEKDHLQMKRFDMAFMISLAVNLKKSCDHKEIRFSFLNHQNYNCFDPESKNFFSNNYVQFKKYSEYKESDDYEESNLTNNATIV